jgi:hypothetical protein
MGLRIQLRQVLVLKPIIVVMVQVPVQIRVAQPPYAQAVGVAMRVTPLAQLFMATAVARGRIRVKGVAVCPGAVRDKLMYMLVNATSLCTTNPELK